MSTVPRESAGASGAERIAASPMGASSSVTTQAMGAPEDCRKPGTVDAWPVDDAGRNGVVTNERTVSVPRAATIAVTAPMP